MPLCLSIPSRDQSQSLTRGHVNVDVCLRSIVELTPPQGFPAAKLEELPSMPLYTEPRITFLPGFGIAVGYQICFAMVNLFDGATEHFQDES